MGAAPILVWIERRVAGLIQDRLGPNRCHINGIRLGGLIHQLRKQGFDIQTQIVKKKKKQYAVYTL